MANRHGRRHTNRGRPRGPPGLQLPPVQAPGPREEGKKETIQDGPRSAGVRSVDREVLIIPDWLARQYRQVAGIQTDQDYHSTAVSHIQGGTGRILQLNTTYIHEADERGGPVDS